MNKNEKRKKNTENKPKENESDKNRICRASRE